MDNDDDTVDQIVADDTSGGGGDQVAAADIPLQPAQQREYPDFGDVPDQPATPSSGSRPDLPVAPLAQQREYPDFGDVPDPPPPPPQPEGRIDTFLREFRHSAPPAAAGFLTGAATGAGLGALGAGPVGSTVGGILGGGWGAYAASDPSEAAQRAMFGDDAAIRQRNAEMHPYWAKAGQLATNLLGFRPSLAMTAKNMAQAGAISGAVEAGQQGYQGKLGTAEGLRDVALSTALGAAAPKGWGPTTLGEKIGARVHQQPVPAVPPSGSTQPAPNAIAPTTNNIVAPTPNVQNVMPATPTRDVWPPVRVPEQVGGESNPQVEGTTSGIADAPNTRTTTPPQSGNPGSNSLGTAAEQTKPVNARSTVDSSYAKEQAPAGQVNVIHDGMDPTLRALFEDDAELHAQEQATAVKPAAPAEQQTLSPEADARIQAVLDQIKQRNAAAEAPRADTVSEPAAQPEVKPPVTRVEPEPTAKSPEQIAAKSPSEKTLSDQTDKIAVPSQPPASATGNPVIDKFRNYLSLHVGSIDRQMAQETDRAIAAIRQRAEMHRARVEAAKAEFGLPDAAAEVVATSKARSEPSPAAQTAVAASKAREAAARAPSGERMVSSPPAQRAALSAARTALAGAERPVGEPAPAIPARTAGRQALAQAREQLESLDRPATPRKEPAPVARPPARSRTRGAAADAAEALAAAERGPVKTRTAEGAPLARAREQLDRISENLPAAAGGTKQEQQQPQSRHMPTDAQREQQRVWQEEQRQRQEKLRQVKEPEQPTIEQPTQQQQAMSDTKRDTTLSRLTDAELRQLIAGVKSQAMRQAATAVLQSRQAATPPPAAPPTAQAQPPAQPPAGGPPHVPTPPANPPLTPPPPAGGGTTQGTPQGRGLVGATRQDLQDGLIPALLRWTGTRASSSSSGRAARDIIMKAEGRAEQEKQIAHHAFTDAMHRAINGSTPLEQRQLANYIQGGNHFPGYQPPPEMRNVANTVRDIYKRFENYITSQPEFAQQQFRDNYMTGHFMDPSGRPAAMGTYAGGGGPTTAGGGRSLRQKRFQTDEEAMAHGLTPVTHNPIERTLMYVDSMSKFISRQEQLGEGQRAGYIEYFRPHAVGGAGTPEPGVVGRPPEGWTRLEGVEQGGAQAYAPREFAEAFNNFHSPGLARIVPQNLLDAWRQTSNAATQIKLLGPAYHAITTVHETLGQALNIAASEMAAGKPTSSIQSLVRGVIRPVTGIGEANRIRDIYLGRAQNVTHEEQSIVDALRNANIKPFGVSHTMDYEMSRAGSMFTAAMRGALIPGWKTELQRIAQTRDIGAGALFIPRQALRLMSVVSQPLFEAYIPRIKLAAQYANLAAWRRANPNAPQEQFQDMAVQITKNADNFMGEAVHDNTFMNKAAKDLMSLAFQSPSFTIGGTLRGLAGGTLSAVKGAAQGQNRFSITSQHYDPRAASALTYALTTGMLGMLYTYAKTGKVEKDDILPAFLGTPHTGGTAPGVGGKGTVKEEGLLPGYHKDIRAYTRPLLPGGKLTDITDELGNKSPVLGQAIADQWRNERMTAYGPEPIVPPHASMAENVKRRATALGQKFLPIFGEQAAQTSKKGSNISYPEQLMGLRPPGTWQTDPTGFAKSADARDIREWKRAENARARDRALRGLPAEPKYQIPAR